VMGLACRGSGGIGHRPVSGRKHPDRAAIPVQSTTRI
jgi:hypothetical protein